MSRKLAELLLSEKLITKDQFMNAEKSSSSGKGFVRWLIDNRHVSEIKLLDYLSKKFGLPSINLDKFEINKDVIGMVDVDLVRRTQSIPIQFNRGTLVVVVCDPSQLQELEHIKFKLKLNVEAVLTTYGAFDRAMGKYFGGAAYMGAAVEMFKKEQKQVTKIKKGGESEKAELELVQSFDVDAGNMDQDAPVISLVNGVLSEAISRGASDIHVEPYEHAFRVRMRIDGKLQEMAQVPMEMKRAVTARFKIMSRMDIAESRLPQDGRIKLKARGREIDFRVNTLPTMFGEKVVLRMLDKSALQLDMTKLGFDEDQMDTFKKGIHSPNGLVLVTGPTGSGKTTTLYSSLQELNKTSENLSTVEDPVEYNLAGINQVQTHKDIGLTFSTVLRALLRQDPDVVLVGEMRDYETAEVGIQAALTGHLVLSTLHTNDAPSSITRLMNMGLEPFLVTASLRTVVAQRLLRMICKSCKTRESVPQERLIELGFPPEAVDQVKLFKGRGCPQCGNSGFKGRVAIYEVMDFTDSLRELVLKGATGLEIKRQAVAEGMATLRISGLNKVVQGVTSLEEAVSKTMDH